MEYNEWMEVALKEALDAARAGDVPVGAVIFDGNGVLLARDHNRREADRDPTAHAELLVIRQAAQKLGSWRLQGTTLVVTLEPCAMCAGALVLGRVQRLVYATRDPKSGAIRSLYQIAEDSRLNHRLEVIEGVQEEAARRVLQQFFRERRPG